MQLQSALFPRGRLGDSTLVQLRAELGSIGRKLDKTKQDLHTLAAFRRLLADLPLSQRQQQQIGLLATRLDEARRLPADEGIQALARALSPALRQARKFSGGRQPGGVDTLGRELLDILKYDPEMPAKDVWLQLEKRQGQGAVLRVTPTHVVCTDGRRQKSTSWESVRDHRLPTLRRLARPRP